MKHELHAAATNNVSLNYGSKDPDKSGAGTSRMSDSMEDRSNSADARMHDPTFNAERYPHHQGQFNLSAIEPFVDSIAAGKFLKLHPATVLRLARDGKLPGHPISQGRKRCHWRFLLSELSDWLRQQTWVA